MNRYEELVSLSFIGERFNDHTLPVDCLKDIIAFRDIVVDLAKMILDERRENRKLITEFTEIKIAGIEQGSSKVVLRSGIQEIVQLDLFDNINGIMQDSVTRLSGLINAVNNDLRIPGNVSKDIIFRVSKWGETLLSGEKVRVTGSFCKPAEFSRISIEKFNELIQKDYEDNIDILGDIYSVDIKNKSFRIISPQGCIPIDYSGEFAAMEDSILEALMKHETTEIRIKGIGLFTWEGRLKSINNLSDIIIRDVAIEEEQDMPTIWDAFEELVREVPEEKLKTIPADFIENHDHYIWG